MREVIINKLLQAQLLIAQSVHSGVDVLSSYDANELSIMTRTLPMIIGNLETVEERETCVKEG
jgi:hypothetical protein